MSDLFIALAVSLPEAFFPDDDDECWVAGREICRRLEVFLADHGHVIAEEFHGGREQEWGRTFESQCKGETFCYDVYFLPYPHPTRDGQIEMAIMYFPKPPPPQGSWLERWFARPEFRWLTAEHPLHATMRSFGKTFDWSAMLTRKELGDAMGVEYV